MGPLRVVTVLVALLIGAGEIARWWGQARFLPMALDELLVAGALLVAAAIAGKAGSGPLAAAWGAFCGLVLTLLVETLDHLLAGPAKARAEFYAIVLAAMLLVGLWGLFRAIRLIGEGRAADQPADRAPPPR